MTPPPSGFSNARPFEGNSIPQIEPAEAQRLVDESNALIVDVREQDEWNAYRIPGAIHVPLSDFMARAAEIPKDRPIVMQCMSGARSMQSSNALLRMGWTEVANLAGGILAWHRAGLPVDQG